MFANQDVQSVPTKMCFYIYHYMIMCVHTPIGWTFQHKVCMCVLYGGVCADMRVCVCTNQDAADGVCGIGVCVVSGPV